MVTLQKGYCLVESQLIVNLITQNQFTLDRNMVLAQSLQIAMLTTTHHVKMVRSTDKGNTSATRIYQMLSGLLGSFVAIGCHAGKAICQTGTSKEHQGDTHFRYFLEMVVIGGTLCQTGYNTFHMHRNKVIDGMLFVFITLMTIGTEHAIALATSLVLNTIKHSRIIMRHQIRHHHTNNLGGFSAQTLSKRVGAIVEFLSQILHTLLHFLAYLR